MKHNSLNSFILLFDAIVSAIRGTPHFHCRQVLGALEWNTATFMDSGFFHYVWLSWSQPVPCCPRSQQDCFVSLCWK